MTMKAPVVHNMYIIACSLTSPQTPGRLIAIQRAVLSLSSADPVCLPNPPTYPWGTVNSCTNNNVGGTCTVTCNTGYAPNGTPGASAGFYPVNCGMRVRLAPVSTVRRKGKA